MPQRDVLAACQQGIEKWKKAFNAQDAKGCAEQYSENCTMHARPFGSFEGRDAIQAFWQHIMDQGLKDVTYSEVNWEQCGEDGFILTSKWTMNKAFGVVHREHWIVESDDHARLVHDDFEVQGER